MAEYTSKINECDSLKKEIAAFRPFPASVIKQLKEYYKINLTYTSNAIEGNSLTESETKVVIEDELNNWVKVRIANGSNGWVEKQTFEAI